LKTTVENQHCAQEEIKKTLNASDLAACRSESVVLKAGVIYKSTDQSITYKAIILRVILYEYKT
jgi:hypothetical protein